MMLTSFGGLHLRSRLPLLHCILLVVHYNLCKAKASIARIPPHPIVIGRLCDTHETRTFALTIKTGEKGIGREDKIKGTVIESILHSNYVASSFHNRQMARRWVGRLMWALTLSMSIDFLCQVTAEGLNEGELTTGVLYLFKHKLCSPPDCWQWPQVFALAGLGCYKSNHLLDLR